MSWGGQGSGWQCTRCSFSNHHSSTQCLECYAHAPNPGWGGYHQQGKGKKGTGDHPPYQVKGDYPPQGYNAQQGNDKEKVSEQRAKLGLMRQMLKNAERIPGWEDKAADLRTEIKEQMKLSNIEQQIPREAQGAIMLQQ
eukprot:4672699-Heterocapsa_arctica.AAC.1